MGDINRVEIGKTNLRDFLAKCRGLYQESNPNLPEILLAVARAVKDVARILSRGKSADLTGTVTAANPFGEATKKIDALAHRAFVKELFSTNRVAFIFSEERKVPDVGIHKAEHLVFIDPLDGSSLVNYNGTTGSIFSVYRQKSGWQFKRESGFPDLNLKDQVFAGYGLYGAATLLVFVLGGIVFEFVLKHFNGHGISEFVLSNAGSKIPVRGKIYSVNEAYSESWPIELKDFIKELKSRGYSSRYVGSLVADFHRTLKEGGIFLYPPTAKHPDGKLRLFYEAGPMAYIIRAAGGGAIDYRLPPMDILNIRGTNATQTTPLVFGSSAELILAEMYLGIQPEPRF